MSFSEDLKTELCKIEDAPCCAKAEAFGLLLFGRSFTRREISLLTKSEAVAQRYENAIRSLTGVIPETSCSDAGVYKIIVTAPSDTIKILEIFGYTGKEITARINLANIENDCCEQAFLRGVFLVAGTITNPEKDYHLEFVTAKQKLSADLLRIVTDVATKVKQINRKNGYALYIKDGESIEDLLAHMGASGSFMHMLSIRAAKKVKNGINRKLNFEYANLNRTIEANMGQLDNIHTIQEYSSLEALGGELYELARLRLENIEATLSELGELMHPPLSRSAVSRRFAKLSAIAEDLSKHKE